MALAEACLIRESCRERPSLVVATVMCVHACARAKVDKIRATENSLQSARPPPHLGNYREVQHMGVLQALAPAYALDRENWRTGRGVSVH